MSTSASVPGCAPKHPRRHRVKIKICGVTTIDDLNHACSLGADFIGLNFYPKSPRYLSLEMATKLRAEMGDRSRAVGVFVNTPASEVARIADTVGLDLVQFHGDEAPEDLAGLTDRSIRALRVGDDFDIVNLEQWRLCWGLLFDAPVEKLYGGSGQAWSYEKVKSAVGRTFLAGGLNPSNVAAAIHRLPDLYAVDVCSGVEASPGIKSHQLLDEFFEQVQSCRTAAK